jgi:hypothetical protein
MNTFGNDQLPGVDTPLDQVSFNPLAAHGSDHFVTKGILIEKDSVDATHVGKTTILRAGTVLLRGAGTAGKFVPAGHASAPANNAILEAVILAQTIEMRAKDGTKADKNASGYIHAFVKDASIFWVDEAGYKTQMKAALPLVRFE